MVSLLCVSWHWKSGSLTLLHSSYYGCGPISLWGLGNFFPGKTVRLSHWHCINIFSWLLPHDVPTSWTHLFLYSLKPCLSIFFLTFLISFSPLLTLTKDLCLVLQTSLPHQRFLSSLFWLNRKAISFVTSLVFSLSDSLELMTFSGAGPRWFLSVLCQLPCALSCFLCDRL